jgi:V/A-type H+-transporting ATPase subunit D
MANTSVATRINLLYLRKRLKILIEGSRLLKNKREALTKEFFEIIEDVLSYRDQLNSTLNEAVENLTMAKIFLGEAALWATSFGSGREFFFDIQLKNIWGVKIPEIEEKSFIRPLETRGLSPVGESLWSLKTTGSFEKALDCIFMVASRETRLRKLGEEIKATSRRINALEEVIIPSTRKDIKNITHILEERERESIYLLKRFKNIVSAQHIPSHDFTG